MRHTTLTHALLFSSLAYGQSSSSPEADGLTATAGSASATVGTVTIDGTPTTFNVPFTVPASADVGPNLLPNIYDPQATQAQDVCPGYTASNVEYTESGFTASLTLAGAPCNVYGTDIEDLTLTLDVQTSHRMRILIEPTYLDSSNESFYRIPAGSLVDLPPHRGIGSEVDLQFSWSNEPSFSFAVVRKSNGDVLVDTTGSVLVYENQFIEFVSQLPENYNLYGMGERIHGLRLGNNFTTTFYAADAGDPIDGNIYSNHPIYYDTRYYEVDEESGERTLVTNQETSADGNYESYTHGVYVRNAHGMEALLLPINITWRTLGGNIDMYVFDGPTTEDVAKQYQKGATGFPAMQSYWTFGFHQCRWGYANWTNLQEIIDNYRSFDIPLEVVWTDIDYMFQYRDFTNDQNTFPDAEGQVFLEGLHAGGQHYIPIVDAAIYIPNPTNDSDSYPVYDDGHERGVFLLNPDGSEYIGAVWPGYTVFPDWRAQEAVAWWTDAMVDHHRRSPWDGIWIDMSEVSSFCIGSCGTGNLTLNPVHPPFGLPGEEGSKIYTYPEGFDKTNSSEAAEASSLSSSQAAAAETPAPSTTESYYRPTVTAGVRSLEDPPYVINNINGPLGVHAVSPNATHADGVLEYDVHNLYGHQLLHATYEALREVFPGKRPFIIGRSTFAGSGRYAGHWGGDNTSLFAYMYFSISQALNFALFGIPMFGVDTCGFNGNSDEELCNRWMQLSAFFPFYRNHNTLSANDQEAYVWASVAEASRAAMKIRYSLLPYMYTLFYAAHTTGSTVMRALSWEYPNDPTLANIDNQFLLGSSLMIVPVLGQGLTEAKGVFPGVAQGEVWYDWYTQAAVDAQPGVNKTIPAPLGHIPVYIRGGSILPQQEAGYTTAESRDTDYSLIVALDASGSATGQLYLDDGESEVPESELLIDLTVAANSLYASIRGLYEDTHPLANITILGVGSEPSSLTLNGADIADLSSYDSDSQVVSVKGLQDATSSGAWAQDWVMAWTL